MGLNRHDARTANKKHGTPGIAPAFCFTPPRRREAGWPSANCGKCAIGLLAISASAVFAGAVYCAADAFEVWAIDGEGHGQLAFTTTADEIAAVDASAANTVVSEGMGIRAFKLTSGEVQVVGAPDFEGKVYHVLFDAAACSLVDTWFD